MTSYWRRWPVPLTFTEPGDKAEGTIVGLGDPKAAAPELHVRTADGAVRVLRITQSRLHERLYELEPAIGDRIQITLTGIGHGDRGAKDFDVKLRRASDKATDSRPPDKGQMESSGEVPNTALPGVGK